jgi:DNA-binding beta-propeller fold protein YncE
MKSSFVLGSLVLLAIAGAAPRATAADAEHYRIVDRLKPGGEGGWDALTVDPVARRLYVSRSTRVQVIDLNTGKLAGEILETPGVHGIALAPEFNRGFASNGRDSSVTIFDLKTLATISKVKLDAKSPDAIIYEPVTKRVFSFNAGSHNTTALDAATGAVVGTVELNGAPEFAVDDGHGHVFVNLEDSSAVVRFDAKTLKVLSRWSLSPGEEPTGIALDAKHHRLFSNCHNQKMMVLDAESGKVVATVPIGTGVDGADFDASRDFAFSSNGEGTLTVVHEDAPDKFSVAETDSTQRSARTLALDPKTHRIYMPAAMFGDAPAATPETPRPRRPMVPDSFVILVLER